MRESLIPKPATYFLKVIPLLILVCLISVSAKAQRCAVPEILHNETGQGSRSTQKFEQWISEKIKVRQHLYKRQATVQVPVVFHIIHNNETEGEGTNIPLGRIIEQLNILNEDFNRQNADSVNTPVGFRGVARSLDIEFVFAKQDPNGNETTGINRVVGSQATYSYTDRDILSSESYWPAEDFLNIWIADLQGSLGWAEFPVSNLEGLEEASGNRLLDGVTVDYEYIGINSESTLFSSFGRTLTHEMGHFFGLRHIWGDDLSDCEVDDYCTDTPASNQPSYGCNVVKSTCESTDMVQNFMDYSDDACMNLFTADQRERVRSIIENSPRRVSLTSSKGLLEPTIFDYDLSIETISDKYINTCDSLYKPGILIKNKGLNNIAEFEVILRYPDGRNEILIINDTILSGQIKQIDFPDYKIDARSEVEFSYSVRLLGSISDQREEDNFISQQLQPLVTRETPYAKSFENGFSDWYIQNEDGKEGWRLISGNAALPLYDKNLTVGQKEVLISPLFSMNEIENAAIRFTYAQTESKRPHTLKIYASYECENSFDRLLYNSEEDFAETAYQEDSVFFPSNRLDWKTVRLQLPNLKGKERVSFKIEVTNQNGNNFYLRDFFVGESNIPDYDVKINSWENVNVIVCDEPLEGTFFLRNEGKKRVSELHINYYQEDLLLDSEVLIQPIDVGQTISRKISLPTYRISENDSIRIELLLLKGNETTFKSNFFYRYRIDCTERLTPIAFTTDKNSPDQFKNFPILNVENIRFVDQEKYIKVLSSKNSGNETRLVSPIVNISELNNFGLIFDYAYNKPFQQQESLQVFLRSIEEGDSKEFLLFNKSGDSLATSFTNDEEARIIWENVFVSLDEFSYLGRAQFVFKISHDGGQDVNLKNISLFVGNERPPAFPNTTDPFVVYPNPAHDFVKVHLNLGSDASGYFSILNSNGKRVIDIKEPKLLNQFVELDVRSLPAGLYFIQLRTKNRKMTKRFIKVR